jgi:hypothetical protein
VLSFRPAVVSGIFFAVDRCQMRRIFIEIRSPDSKHVTIIGAADAHGVLGRDVRSPASD